MANSQDLSTPEPERETQPQRHWFIQLLTQVSWSLVILLIFAACILYMIYDDNAVLRRLQEPAYARGVITFLVSLAAIGLAFMFAYQAFSDEKTSEDGFRRGREVLTGLMGVLGTIVGFYFGSTDKAVAAHIDVAARQENAALIIHATGGTPPYHAHVTFEPKNIQEIDVFPSKDGWIVVPLTDGKATKVLVDIEDVKDIKASKSLELKSTAPVPAPDEEKKDQPADSSPMRGGTTPSK